MARRKRRSFYETQTLMQRALDEEAAQRQSAAPAEDPPSEPDRKPAD